MANENELKKKLLKSLLQAVMILLAGAVLGSAFNAFRHDGLPWGGEARPSTTDTAVPSIGVSEAWRDYRQGKVQFVDARTPSEYEAGHLPGALSIPEEQAGSFPGAVRLPADREIVVYCSDPSCPKSGRLAALLAKRGVKGLKVMPEGWAGWYDAGLPFEGKGEG